MTSQTQAVQSTAMGTVHAIAFTIPGLFYYITSSTPFA